MILGISIDENFVYVHEEGTDKTSTYPFAIGKNLKSKTWFIGDEARNENIDNVDIVIDKLFYIVENDGTARIGEDEYEAKDLVKYFFNNLLSKFQNIEYVTLVVRKNDIRILSKLKEALIGYFKDTDKFKITTYSEGFTAYLLKKGEDFYRNNVALFDFTEKAITFYELVRYVSSNGVEYWKTKKTENLSLPLDLLSNTQGSKLCDNVLLDFSKKNIGSNVFSSIILSGQGFKDSTQYREFMTYVCSIANVETDELFFAHSASIISRNIVDHNEYNNIVLVTDARTTASISILTEKNGEPYKVELIKPGEEWFNLTDFKFDIIADNSDGINFEIIKVIEGVINKKFVALPEGSGRRTDKTNMYEVKIEYSQQNIMDVSITDKGFGEFYEKTGLSTFKKIEI